ncbi:DNA (Cytosine-5)-methyltransferase DRM1/2 isoform 3 [Hibiscus syriacus]|uniref:DNA (Cytosine-5)-methyltransferase DRM1/2 isoform 3 n=1 Tax=Hibiscus syriacus TaxID=106335 RepID=A0A6A2YPK6_HIBSY|nr:DNA (Cytosine-5)-methyltransferase DRM1/2 isoform 3 [Hibiscus syriacus]
MLYITDIDSSSDTEEILNFDSDEENKLLYLTKMEALIALKSCGPDSSIVEFTDFICAAQMAKAADALLPVEDRKPLCNDPNYKKRAEFEDSSIFTELDQITQRTLPEDAIGPPYIYYENLPLASVGVWIEMSWYLYDVEPEFEDSKNKVAPLEPDEVEMLLELAFYYLGIPLKIDAQELNSDRLELLMSRFGEFDLFVVTASYAASRYTPTYPTLPEPWKGLVDSKIGYLYFWNPVTNDIMDISDKENDRHGRSINDVSRLKPASRYNQSANGGLVHSYNIP